VVADFSKYSENLDVLKKALGDLLALGIMVQVLEAKDFAFAGQGKLLAWSAA
jgi:hypothetical protein